MASEVFVNIKNLPETEQINPGDYLIVETQAGTNILNFENFIITAANTTFSNLLSTNNVDNAANITTSINALSTTISKTYPKMYYGTASIDLKTNKSGSVTLIPAPPTSNVVKSLTVNDVIITPANSNSLSNSVYVTGLTKDTINPSINVTVSHAVSGNNSRFNLSIIKPYY